MKLLRNLWEKLTDEDKLAADRRAFLRGMTYTSAGLLVGVPLISIPREPWVLSVPGFAPFEHSRNAVLPMFLQELIAALRAGAHGTSIKIGVPVGVDAVEKLLPPFDPQMIKARLLTLETACGLEFVDPPPSENRCEWPERYEADLFSAVGVSRELLEPNRVFQREIMGEFPEPEIIADERVPPGKAFMMQPPIVVDLPEPRMRTIPRRIPTPNAILLTNLKDDV